MNNYLFKWFSWKAVYSSYKLIGFGGVLQPQPPLPGKFTSVLTQLNIALPKSPRKAEENGIWTPILPLHSCRVKHFTVSLREQQDKHSCLLHQRSSKQIQFPRLSFGALWGQNCMLVWPFLKVEIFFTFFCPHTQIFLFPPRQLHFAWAKLILRHRSTRIHLHINRKQEV